jgi:bile acid:Na+ symporter, BASS family
MSDSTLLLCSNLAKLTLFSLMLSLGVTLRLEQILLLWQRPGLLNPSILATIVVVVPMLVALMVFSFQLPQEVEIRLILTAIAPGTRCFTDWTLAADCNWATGAGFSLDRAFLGR